METTITTSAKNQARSHTLNRIAEGKLSLADGASQLGLSERQLSRLRRAVVQAGPAALVHGNTGRASPHRIEPAIRAWVVELATTRYAGVNDSHMAELLAERERSRSAGSASGGSCGQRAGRAPPPSGAGPSQPPPAAAMDPADVGLEPRPGPNGRRAAASGRS